MTGGSEDLAADLRRSTGLIGNVFTPAHRLRLIATTTQTSFTRVQSNLLILWMLMLMVLSNANSLLHPKETVNFG